MASEYTSHYNLDKYVATDKPNLRDQYNAAMDKIDAELWVQRGEIGTALNAANSAVEQVSQKASKEDLTALGNKLPTGSFSNTNTVKKYIDDKFDGAATDADLNALKGIIPASAYSSSNTIKKAIDSKASTTSVTSLTNRVASLEQAIPSLGTEHKLVLLIGDSYGTGWTPDGGTETDGWCYKLNNILHAISGLPVIYNSTGGCGFARTDSLAFSNRLNGVISDMSDTEKSQCGLVLIAGGANDFNGTASGINTGVYNCANLVKNNLPNAKLIISYVGCIIPSLVSGDWAGATGEKFKAAYMNYMEAAGRNGCGFTYGSNAIINLRSQVASDGIHPNGTGNTQIARFLATFLRGGTGSTSIRCSAPQTSGWFSKDSKWSTVDNLSTFYGSFSANGVPLSWCLGFPSNLGFQAASPFSFTFDGQNGIRLGRINLPAYGGWYLTKAVRGYIYSTTSPTFFDFSGTLYKTVDNYVDLAITKINTTGDNFMKANVKQIVLSDSGIAW